MIKPTKPEDITFKQRKWLKFYIDTGNATKAARLAGYGGNTETLANIGWENVRKLDMSDLMEEMGLTDVVLTNVLAEGLTKPVKADITGAIHPDYTTRHKYLETALKTKKKVGLEDNPQTPNINITFTRGNDNGS